MTKQELISVAREIFSEDGRPAVFVDPNHCSECTEHNDTLLTHTPETISLNELGNPGWDPMCFVQESGFKYYFPAMVRLVLESNEDDDYLSQFLFHITSSPNCQFFNQTQASFVVKLLQYLEDERWAQLEETGELEELLRAKELWINR